MTWNLNGRVKGCDEQLAFVARNEPDIVTLQEVTKNSVSKLVAGLAEIGLPYSVPTTIPEKPRYGVLVASRWPLREMISTVASERQLTVFVDLISNPFTVVTTHIPPGSMYGFGKVRALEAAKAEALSSEGPVLLTGDFNSPQLETEEVLITWAQVQSGGTWRTVRTRGECAGERWDSAERWLFSGELTDVFRSVHGSKAAHSWVLHRKNKCEVKRRFDHILASPHWKVREASYLIEALDQKLSDHAPLLADLSLE